MNNRTKIIILIIVPGVLIGLTMLPFALQSGPSADDWSHLSAIEAGSSLGMLLRDRPLAHIQEIISYALFKYDWSAHVGLSLITLWASAIVFGLSLELIMPARDTLVMVATALFVTCPLVSSRLWFAASAYPQALFLTSLAIWLSIKWILGDLSFGRMVLGSGFLYLLSLLSIEIQAALVGIVPILAWFFRAGNGQRIRRSVSSFLPYLEAGIIWIGFRLIVVPRLGLFNPKGSGIEIPSLGKLLLEAAWPWVGTFLSTFVILPLKVWSGLSQTFPTVFMIAIFSIIFISIVCIICDQRGGRLGDDTVNDLLVSQDVLSKWVVGAGLAMILLGYLPILFTDSNTYELPLTYSSRIAYAMTPGWAIAGAGTGWWLSHRLGRWMQPNRLFLLYSVIVVGMCSAFTVSSNLDYVQRWEIQRRVLRNVRAMAPALADNTYVVITGEPGVIRALDMSFPLLQSFEKRGNGVYVFGSAWEVRGAMQVLYQNPTLAGDVLKREFVMEVEENGRFGPGGYVPAQIEVDTPSIVPYERLLVVQYDQQGCVRLVSDGSQIGAGTIPEGALKGSPAHILPQGKASPADQILGAFAEQPCWFR